MKRPEEVLAELRAFAARQDRLAQRQRELAAELRTVETQLDEVAHLREETLKHLDGAVTHEAVYHRTGEPPS